MIEQIQVVNAVLAGILFSSDPANPPTAPQSGNVIEGEFLPVEPANA